MRFDRSSDLSGLIASARAQHQAGAGAVLDILLREAGPQEGLLLDRLREEAGVEVVRGTDHAPDFSRLSAEAAARLRCVQVVRPGVPGLWLAMADPWDQVALQQGNREAGLRFEPVAAPGGLLQAWLHATTPTSAEVRPANGGGEVAAVDGPIVAFVDSAIRAGFLSGASDIHFECDRHTVTVKHRLDGVMTRFAKLDGAVRAQEVISRVKVLAQLDITERRVPQDGRFRFALKDHPDGAMDMRVSIMPSVFGEDAVLRLLDKAQLRAADATASLDRLGFDVESAARLRQLASQPSGMLLITGPTGSGKTTTVYAALSEINTGLEKIITIEDPVEYELPGVLQIPVNERKGLTFAKGLRSILRHDPDRILVGEIRDAETAEIAVQSALTGHLVFTTVHANSMTDIIGRFRHFGLDMFGFMSSLNGVVVQRLMRGLCVHCRRERPASAGEAQWLAAAGQAGVAVVPEAVGCEACRHTGYKGRFVVSEVHVIDDTMRDHVTEGAPLSVFKRHAYDQGVATLAQRSAHCVVSGETSLEEVRRVVGWL